MARGKKFDVFLSHNSIDKPWVSRLKDALQARGLRVWLDRDEIRPGDLFVGALETGLEESKAVALIISPESVASAWVKEEYSRAMSLANDKKQPLQLIPVILREAKLPGFLASRSWIDFSDESAFDNNLEQLIWGITNKKPDNSISRTVEESSEDILSKVPEYPSTNSARMLKYKTASIRKLLSEALTDQDLDDLCMDYFPRVYNQFSSGMGKQQKTQRLIEYCNRHNQFAYLMDLVKPINPEKFAEYEGMIIRAK